MASSECDQHKLAFSTCSASVIPFPVAGRPNSFYYYYYSGFARSLFECVEMCVWKYKSKALCALKAAPLVRCTELPQHSTLQLIFRFLSATACANILITVELRIYFLFQIVQALKEI